MNQRLHALADELEHERSTLERELAEIELLMRQTATEVERHEERRVQAEQRLAAIERDPAQAHDAVVEARAQLLSQTRRATLMQAQLDVLAGKQRALDRFRDRLATAVPVVREAADGDARAHGDGASDGVEQGVHTESGANGRQSSSAEVMAAQERMRREIARQMHDGPAQSIANIALQAQIVQRLFERNPAEAAHELTELVAMVQQTLEATTNFIFDVRPMVLDDLGLVPTLRRTAAERGRRSGVPVRFESVGADARLAPEVESALFRIVDDAVLAYIADRPPEVLIRFDWMDHGLRATVRGRPAERDDGAEARATVAAARHERSLPSALASMIREQETAGARPTGLTEQLRHAMEQRAASAGIAVKLSADLWQLEASVAARP